MIRFKSCKRLALSLVPLAFIALADGSIIGGPRHAIEDYTPVFAAAENGDLDAVKEAVAEDPRLVGRTEMEGKPCCTTTPLMVARLLSNIYCKQGPIPMPGRLTD